MYLVINESREVFKTRNIDSSDKESADGGVLDIIDIHDPETPKEYYNGDWHPIMLVDKSVPWVGTKIRIYDASKDDD